ncbi:hypothetical protein JHK82_015963 [Glycine max]|nr:hypothetical protein JHK82_015963 [Glycine max]
MATTRLQEAILTIPRGITQLMDMLMDREVLLRETVGLDSLILILKLRGSSFTFNQQKKKVLDHLLILGVESQCVPVLVRGAAMQCIGDLIAGDSKNRDLLASKVLGEEPHIEPTLNSILRILLRTSSMQEFIAIDYIFKSFCEYLVLRNASIAEDLAKKCSSL